MPEVTKTTIGDLKKNFDRGAVFMGPYGTSMAISLCGGMADGSFTGPMGNRERTAIVVLDGEKRGCTYFYDDDMEVERVGEMPGQFPNLV